MNTTDRRQAAIGLLRDYMGGRIDRRQLLKSAAAAGALLPVLSIMRGASPAFAQDASPVADANAGSTIVVPADLRTDLSGSAITWMGLSLGRSGPSLDPGRPRQVHRSHRHHSEL